MAEYVEVRREPIDYEVRGFILRRDNYACRYCGSKKEPFHLDHVYPVSKGGETSVGNLVTSCQRCNNEKRARVGVWPKPIGYFEKDKKDNTANYVFMSLIAQIFLWSGASDYNSFRVIGEIQIVLAFVVVVVFLLPNAIKTHIKIIRELL